MISKSLVRKVIVEGGVYHITQRAPGKELLFLENSDYLRFLSLLKKIRKEFNLNIFCFSLLPNHLHIFLKIKDANLDKAMRKLFQSYAQYFNKKYQRKGHVFCGVYRASLCSSDDYLITASIYIHLNAFKAGLAESPFLYKWHSLDVYLKSINNAFIEKKPIMDVLSLNSENAKKIYRELIEKASGVEYENIIENKLAVRNFYGKFFNYLRGKTTDRPDLFKEISSFEKQIEIFMNKKKVCSIEDKKALKYLIEQLKSRGFSTNEIAKRLNYNRCRISTICNKSVSNKNVAFG